MRYSGPLLLATLFIFTTCGNDDNLDEIESRLDDLEGKLLSDSLNAESDTYVELTGTIEKGAFLSGSRLVLYELDSTLAQTGRAFTAEVENDFGDFNLTALNLLDKTCLAVANGFYYDEVRNRSSTAPISLNAIVRISENETVNVNVLTHLEQPRVEHLLRQGLSFDEAKTQALTEVLQIFSIENPGLDRAEKIGLIGDQIENDILLSISIIAQGYRSEGELSDLLAKISDDLEEDGILNEQDLGNQLRSDLRYIYNPQVIENVRSRYQAKYSEETLVGLSTSVIDSFVSNTSYQETDSVITYPSMVNIRGFTSANILNESFDRGEKFSSYRMAAFLTEPIPLTIVVTRESGMPITGSLSIGNNLITNWQLTFTDDLQFSDATITTSIAGLSSLQISFQETGNYVIQFFEKGGVVETARKTITIE